MTIHMIPDLSLRGSMEEDDSSRAACLPWLPTNHTTQTVGLCSDDTGLRHYEFRLVYHPTQRVLDRAWTQIEVLDADQSYWVVTRAERGASGDEHPVSRWITYGQARSARGAHLTFQAFSALQGGELRMLLPD